MVHDLNCVVLLFILKSVTIYGTSFYLVPFPFSYSSVGEILLHQTLQSYSLVFNFLHFLTRCLYRHLLVRFFSLSLTFLGLLFIFHVIPYEFHLSLSLIPSSLLVYGLTNPGYPLSFGDLLKVVPLVHYIKYTITYLSEIKYPSCIY